MGVPHTYRQRHVADRLAAVALLAGGLVILTAGPAFGAATLSLSKSSGLTQAQVITVTGSGLHGGSYGYVLECNGTPGEPRVRVGPPFDVVLPVGCARRTSNASCTPRGTGTLSTTFRRSTKAGSWVLPVVCPKSSGHVVTPTARTRPERSTRKTIPAHRRHRSRLPVSPVRSSSWTIPGMWPRRRSPSWVEARTATPHRCPPVRRLQEHREEPHPARHRERPHPDHHRDHHQEHRHLAHPRDHNPAPSPWVPLRAAPVRRPPHRATPPPPGRRGSSRRARAAWRSPVWERRERCWP